MHFLRSAVVATGSLALFTGLINPTAAHAQAVVYQTSLNGSIEDPPNTSPGSGTAFLTIDDVINTMRLQVSFSGLIGTTTVAHIHAPTAIAGTGTAGVATPTPSFPGFPTGVTSGAYDQIFDMTLASSYRAGFITGNGGTPATAQAALFSAIAGGKAYLNIHTTAFPGGEIRGFFTPVPGPLPLLGVGAAFGWSRRMRRRQRLNSQAS